MSPSRIHWPSHIPEAQAVDLLRRLAADITRPPLVFEASGSGGAASHRLIAPPGSGLDGLLSALVPGTTLTPDQGDTTPYTVTLEARLSGGDLGLSADRAAETSRLLLAALAAAGEDETITIQLVLADGHPPRIDSGTRQDPTQGLLSQALFGVRPMTADLQRRIRTKAAEPRLRASLRLAATAETRFRAERLLRGLIAALRTAQTAGTRLSFVTRRPERFHELPRRGQLVLSVGELAGLLAWPLNDDDLPGLPAAHPKPLYPAAAVDRTRVFAETTAPGETLPLGIAIEDALQHLVVTGGTGSGKSTLLLNLIAADMMAGRSVVVIDPKTDLAMDVLARVPENRRDDVVVIDPTQEFPVGLNPLSQGRSPDLTADGILAIFRDLYPNLFGPRTSDVLHAALLTLACIEDATLAWLPKLLTNRAYRRTVVPLVRDDVVRSFWQEFDSLKDAAQLQYVGPVLSRLRQFLLRPALRRVLDQADPRFTLSEVLTKRRIVLVPLNAGLLGGEAARLLGSLLVSQLWGLTLGRAALPPEKRHPVSVYIDEAQEFLRLGGELPDALARSRSLGVAWHLAHQYRDQFTPEVRSAIDANARSKVAFALGIKDARDLAAMSTDLTPEDFLALPLHHVYAQLVAGGQPGGWVSGKTLPPPPVTSDPDALIRGSQRRYGLRPDDTTAAATTPIPPDTDPGSPYGRRPRRHD